MQDMCSLSHAKNLLLALTYQSVASLVVDVDVELELKRDRSHISHAFVTYIFIVRVDWSLAESRATSRAVVQ